MSQMVMLLFEGRKVSNNNSNNVEPETATHKTAQSASEISVSSDVVDVVVVSDGVLLSSNFQTKCFSFLHLLFGPIGQQAKLKESNY